MPWDEIATKAPALAALCLVVLAFAGVLWKIVGVFIDTVRSFMEKTGELSKSCHESHDRIAAATTSSIDRNTEAMGSCRECQRETTKAMTEITFTLRTMNGRGKGEG